MTKFQERQRVWLTAIKTYQGKLDYYKYMDPELYGDEYEEPVQPSTPKQMPAPHNGLRWRRFVFTLNNYTDDELRSIKTLSDVRWMIIGKETAPGSGTPHLQGAVCLTKQMTFRSLKNIRGFRRAHLAQMRGTPQHSRNYCSKQDPNPYERGSLPEPGKRNDLETAAEHLTSGMTMKQLARTMPATVAHYCNGLTKLRALLLDGRKDKPLVMWIWGETGTGKTRAAFELGNLYKSVWMSNDTLKWMDGYDGQRVAILDDFRPDDCPFNLLLKLLDRFPLLVQYKGGYVDWIPQIIIITSPMPPSYMYQSKPHDDIAQLLRRIDFIFELPNDGKEGFLLDAVKRYGNGLVDLIPLVDSDSGSDGVIEPIDLDSNLADALSASKKHLTSVDVFDDEEDKGKDTEPFSDEDIFEMS